MDQWKEDGICGQCRRQNYCKKRCRPNRERYIKEVQRTVRNKLLLGNMLDKAKGAPTDGEIHV